VSDAKKVRASGRGLQPTGVRVGDVADFKIYTEGAGEGHPDVRVIGPGTHCCGLSQLESVLFIVHAYHFENDYLREVSVICRGLSVTSPVMSHQVTEFIGSVADRKVHSLFVVLSNYLNVTTFL